MTKQQKIDLYGVYKAALVKKFPNLTADLSKVGIPEEYKKVIDANTQIGQNVGTANAIVLHNDVWENTDLMSGSYADKEQLYFMFAREANTGSVTMKVGTRPEHPVYKDGHVELQAGDIEENKLYIFKLCSSRVGCGTLSYHWHLIPVAGGISEATVDTKILNAINALKDGVSAEHDTLKEIEDALNETLTEQEIKDLIDQELNS